ncbi:MAG: type IIA DNA topoisomerase subunit B [Bacteroidales bacterium]|jgi:topoisomerase-4 subunit B|nr:type IIA DNA topoisomerase subunit B [Bacteroidales bacterium]
MSETNGVKQVEYTDKNIITLEDLEHVRRRPGMYIGKLGDGSHVDDGIYVLLKEVLDNSVDEFRMGEGKQINVTLRENHVEVRDFGRGIPLGKMIDAMSVMNTGGKYDSKAFKKSVGLNGVGSKAVNALSEKFIVQSFREGQSRRAEFKQGKIVSDSGIIKDTESQRGTYVYFEPDDTMFEKFKYNEEFVNTMLRNYAYLNTGLTFNFNDTRISSKNGLLDLLNENITSEILYPIIHLKGEDIEVAFTHTNQYGEEYYSFVNGQHTTQGGTHQSAFREAVGRTIKEFFNKNMELNDIRNGIVAAISISVEEPVFESQTKTKLGSRDMAKDGVTINKHISDFLKKELDNYLHRNLEISNIIHQKIQESEKERKAIAGVTKVARERAKKANLYNKKLRDCRIHYNDSKGNIEDTCIFITEGDSASGSITKSRDVNTQAVFSLRGKPLNSYGLTKKVVYENEEFNLLQAALNIEDGLDGLRYNKVIVATDADVDGMHIRLLLITFFLQFFPDLIKKGHVYILQTPLFRVRNKKETIYCYSEEERLQAIAKLSPNPEITRFKGLGEISPDEFKHFIGKDMRLDQVTLKKEDAVADLLEFYMGKNTSERQNFIIENLVVEEDVE